MQAPTAEVEALAYHFDHFSPKMHENEKQLDPKGAGGTSIAAPSPGSVNARDNSFRILASLSLCGFILEL